MIVLESGTHVDAVTVIKEAGFVDITPDVSTVTHKFFERDGKLFVFNGWHRLDEKKHWQDVEMVQIKPVPADQADLERWIRRWEWW